MTTAMILIKADSIRKKPPGRRSVRLLEAAFIVRSVWKLAVEYKKRTAEPTAHAVFG